MLKICGKNSGNWLLFGFERLRHGYHELDFLAMMLKFYDFQYFSI